MENKETYTKLFKLVEKLKNAEDPKRKYEFILWLGKKLKVPDNNI
jgi:cysteine desulfuration protein SufE